MACVSPWHGYLASRNVSPGPKQFSSAFSSIRFPSFRASPRQFVSLTPFQLPTHNPLVRLPLSSSPRRELCSERFRTYSFNFARLVSQSLYTPGGDTLLVRAYLFKQLVGQTRSTDYFLMPPQRHARRSASG